VSFNILHALAVENTAEAYIMLIKLNWRAGS